MSAPATTSGRTVFRVLDAMDAPHEGRILRLRLDAGDPPSIRSLKGREMVAISPDGRQCRFRVEGFAVDGDLDAAEEFQVEAGCGDDDVRLEFLAGL